MMAFVALTEKMIVTTGENTGAMSAGLLKRTTTTTTTKV